MNKTNKIYFLAAIVMMLGCYALNLSYSYFVQTEEKNTVDSRVAELSYDLSQSTFSINANSTKVVRLAVSNTSSISMNYGLIAQTDAKNYKIQTIDSNSYGTLAPSSTQKIDLAITNNEEKCITVNFSLDYNYTTINFDELNYLTKSNINNQERYEYNFPDKLNDLIIKNNSIFTTDENKETINASLVKIKTETNNFYYFKGNVINNYVSYNNMCFRIVNVDDEGNIKIVLASENSCSNENLTDESGYAKLSKDYINISYAKKDNNEMNYENSNLLDTLNIWFDNKVSNKDNLVKYNWCSDNTIANGVYNSYDRIVNSKIPSYECKGKIIENYIGTLTADEVMLANNENDKNYLYENAKNYGWWTITPHSSGEENKIFVIKDSIYEDEINMQNRIRPVLVLKNDTLATGTGTIDNPYVIDNIFTTKSICEQD